MTLRSSSSSSARGREVRLPGTCRASRGGVPQPRPGKRLFRMWRQPPPQRKSRARTSRHELPGSAVAEEPAIIALRHRVGRSGRPAARHGRTGCRARTGGGARGVQPGSVRRGRPRCREDLGDLARLPVPEALPPSRNQRQPRPRHPAHRGEARRAGTCRGQTRSAPRRANCRASPRNGAENRARCRGAQPAEPQPAAVQPSAAPRKPRAPGPLSPPSPRRPHTMCNWRHTRPSLWPRASPRASPRPIPWWCSRLRRPAQRSTASSSDR